MTLNRRLSMNRIRNAWAVLTGKAIVCTHPAEFKSTFSYTMNGEPWVASVQPGMTWTPPAPIAEPIRFFQLNEH